MSSQDEQEEVHNSASNKVTLVAGKLVRFVLSVAESQNAIITRSRLQKRTKEITDKEECGSVTLNAVLKETNRLLGDIYGYELKSLPPRGVAPAGGQAVTAQHYILLDKKPPVAALDDFMFSQGVNTYLHTVQDGQYIGGRLNLETTNTITNKLGCDADTTQKGLLCVILCVVLFSKNHILQQELYEQLAKFGVPTDGSLIPIINVSILELLNLLVKQEYLEREVERSGAELEVEIYRTGRRTRAEFPLESLLRLVMELMDVTEEQAPGLRQDIERNIADSYAVGRTR